MTKFPGCRSAYDLAQKESTRAKELADSSFAMAQQTVGSAATSALAQMNFRLAKNEPRFAELLRERQSLVDDGRKLDKALADSILISADRRNLSAEEGEWARMSAADARIGDIDRTLAERFPDYAALAQSPPLGIAGTQELLRQVKRWCFSSKLRIFAISTSTKRSSGLSPRRTFDGCGSSAARLSEGCPSTPRLRSCGAAGLAAGRIVVSRAVCGRPDPASANAAAGDDRRALRCRPVSWRARQRHMVRPAHD
jgi:hypothetical protein